MFSRVWRSRATARHVCGCVGVYREYTPPPPPPPCPPPLAASGHDDRYRVDLTASKDPARPMLRLRSMYAEHESDCLLFQQAEHGLELVETPLALQHMDKVRFRRRRVGAMNHEMGEGG